MSNRKRGNEVACTGCGAMLKGKQRKYCSHKCQHTSDRDRRISEWFGGVSTPSMANGELAHWARNYLKEAAGSKCSLCPWDRVNPTSGKVPLEIDHIDGRFNNNDIGNLRVLCPGCHSLTPNYGALNRGKGREYRYK